MLLGADCEMDNTADEGSSLVEHATSSNKDVVQKSDIATNSNCLKEKRSESSDKVCTRQYVCLKRKTVSDEKNVSVSDSDEESVWSSNSSAINSCNGACRKCCSKQQKITGEVWDRRCRWDSILDEDEEGKSV